jgi:hypothetical protein
MMNDFGRAIEISSVRVVASVRTPVIAEIAAVSGLTR